MLLRIAPLPENAGFVEWACCQFQMVKQEPPPASMRSEPSGENATWPNRVDGAPSRLPAQIASLN
jgi:hypothetical protein